jgi:hypothetical protein
MAAPRGPAHLLLGIHSSMQQPLHRALGDRRRNRFFTSAGGRVVDDDVGLSGYVVSRSPRRRTTLRAAVAASLLGSKQVGAHRTLTYTRPAADPLFISAAQTHRQRIMGIVLSGGGGRAAGLRVITEFGGTAIVQDPQEAQVPSMPLAAIMAHRPEIL